MKLLIYFIAILTLPLAVIISRNGAIMQTLPMIASTLGLAMLLWGLVNIIRKGNIRLAGLIGSLLLMLALLSRFILGFLYDFSGRGFSSDVFSQLNPAALKIAVLEYDNQLGVMALLFLIIAYFLIRLNHRQAPVSSLFSIALIPIATTLIYYGADGSPEMQMAQAYQHFANGGETEDTRSREVVRAQSVELLNAIRPVDKLPIGKSELQVKVPEKPLNLILIYLESFNETMSDNKLYPGLTPRIAELKDRFHSFDQIHSSSYVTIEGVANSQCGTLMNMEYANSSLVTRKGRLRELPCLGDILHTAGYQQSYFGGAELVFAGKGAFFRDHGYDEVNGWEHWDDLGYERFGDWGLSDTHLFNQAYEAILEKHKREQPFNMTLLTLGTHVPGFVYDECPIYSEKEHELFLNAIHCTDYLLGQFIDKLENSGILEDTVLLAQADHGVFLRPDILKLFGKTVVDTRLFTLLSVPESHQLTDAELGLHREGSNLNMVATLLDLMQIEHNSSFIFSQSHFHPDKDKAYYPSRRQDYSDFKRVDNDRYKCDDPTRSAPLALPLDNCDKDRVMQTISSLNLTYAPNEATENQVCQLAANTRVDNETGQILIKWGNQNLSDQFYRRGSKRNKHHTKGIYAVLLSEQNEVTQTLFFEQDREEDMRDIGEVFIHAGAGDKMLFVRNADMDNLPADVDKLWPDFLRNQTIVYGIFDGQNLVPEFVSTADDLESQFKPGHCSS